MEVPFRMLCYNKWKFCFNVRLTISVNAIRARQKNIGSSLEKSSSLSSS